MNTELTLLHKRLEREKTARRRAEILLEQKSLQLWEANRKLQLSLDEKSKELQGLNSKLSVSLQYTSEELDDNLSLLNEYKKAIDHSTVVSMTDKEGIIIYANDAFCKISGYTREELIGQNHNIIRHPDNPRKLYTKMWKD